MRIRGQVRYRCFGDGMCCSDMHAIGALEEDEVVRLQAVDPDVVGYSDLADAHVLRMRPDGTCPFLGDTGCMLHEPMNGLIKPHPCWRFPYGLTATPTGGRITTEHRCSCRTIGRDRPEVPLEKAAQELVERDGRTRANHTVDAEVAIRRDEMIPFAEYEAIEAPMLKALLEEGARPEDVIDRQPFPNLIEGTWGAIAGGMRVVETDSRFDDALSWFGAAIDVRDGGTMDHQARPWTESFDRVLTRVPEADDAEAMIRDWVADSLWSLYWTAYGSFEQARCEMATRLWLLRRLAQEFVSLGSREDVATAEALMIVDLVGTSEWWEGITARLSEAD